MHVTALAPRSRSSVTPSSRPSTARSVGALRQIDPDAALAASGKSTTVESNHASPPYQSGACPAGPSSNACVGQSSRFRDLPRSRIAPSGFAICGLHGASPGNRTLLAGFTTRGLASSRATQSRREESNPRTSTVGAWCSPLSYGEMNALDGSRTRLARQTTGSRLQTRPRACCEVPRAGIEPALPV